MPVHFKGLSEYQSKFKTQRVRWEGVSPQLGMQQAGLRSVQAGITREPQFLSKKRVPFYRPQVPKSLQWEGPTEPRREPQEREVCRSSPSFVDPPVESLQGPETPLAPRSPKPPEGQCADVKLDILPQSSSPKSEGPKQSPGQPATEDKQAQNGVQHALRQKAALKSAERRCRYQPSEYQQQFTWKAPTSNSPLLAAEQMVYSNSVVPPFKTDPLVYESEYRRNFKGALPPRGPRLRRELVEREGHLQQPENVSPLRLAKGKRMKKPRQCGRKSGQRNGSPEPAGERTQQEMMSTKYPWRSAPCSGCRKVKTEYISNFRSPLLYRYKDGVWIKASATGEQACDSDHAYMWYNEVRELWEKAKAYRKRAWGTHFSRDHLNQILSEQNRLWEVSSTTSSVTTGQDGSGPFTALDPPRIENVNGSLDPTAAPLPPASRRSSKGDAADAMGPNAPILSEQRKLAWGEAEKGDEAELVGKAGMEPRENEEWEVDSDQDKDHNNQLGMAEKQHRSPVLSSEISSQEGRLPTPKLKATTAGQRTHLDLTTPVGGGAILVSPPTLKGSLQGIRRCEPALGKPTGLFKRLSQTSTQQDPAKADDGWAQTRAQAAGLNTQDPIPLREDVLEDSPSPPNMPVPHHARSSGKHSSAACHSASVPDNRIQGTLRDPEFQHNGNLGLKRPELFIFPSSDTTTSDDDRMSQISSRSAASCSLASQVLARAQKRKEDFWGKS